jgi:AP2 domain
MRTVPLHGKNAAGRVAVVDDEDFELVAAYRWTVRERLRPSGAMEGPYAHVTVRRNGRSTKLSMHALITGNPRTDHVDHNGLNNQRSNLRPATCAQNNHNQRPRAGHSSQYKGVTWHSKRGKWQASIKVNGKSEYLGVFTDEDSAAEAYDQAAAAAYGEYAYLNRVTAA